MSTSNESNRPSLCLPLGDRSASAKILALYAHKKIRVHSASLVQDAVLAASGVNYTEAQLELDGVGVGTAVDNQAGLAARGPLDLDMGANGYVDLEIGSSLGLDLVKNGTGSLDESSLILDCEIIGN